MPIKVVYPSSRSCLLSRALALPLLASLGLSKARRRRRSQARSSRDGITIVEALGVRLGPGRRRLGILMVSGYSGTSPRLAYKLGRRSGLYAALITTIPRG
jgi:hypothetical protein